MVLDPTGNPGEVGNLSGFNGSSVDYFEISRRVESITGEVVLAYKVFVDKCKARCACVNHCGGLDRMVTVTESSCDKRMLSF